MLIRVQLEAATKKRRGGRPSLPSSTEPWLERATTIFASLDGSASLMTSSSSRSVVPIPPSTMTLRNRNKEKTPPVPIPSLEDSNDTNNKLMIGKNIVDENQKKQKDEAGTYSGDQKRDGGGGGGGGVGQSSGLMVNSTTTTTATIEGDETSTRKKLPRVILRLGKPPAPDLSV